MAAIDVEKKFNSIQKTLGKATANALFPDESEYYFLSLELVDSIGGTVDYFAWPVLPDDIQDNHVEITTIRKTIGGVTVLKNPTFAPRQISIRGDFGRRFKTLINGQKFDFSGIVGTVNAAQNIVGRVSSFDVSRPQFSILAKSGYGCVKVIERMKERSKQLDRFDKPYTLFLHNPILGNNYVVEFNSFTHKQDSGKYNMIPNYAIQLTAIAPTNGLFSIKQRIKSTIDNVAFGVLKKNANSLSNSVSKVLGTKRKF